MKNITENLALETVLVLQGGGSLGAYECGVFKALYENGIKFDILAGSSIGAINASIICAAQNEERDASKVLIDFWSDLSEDIFRPELPQLWPFLIDDEVMAFFSSLYSMTYGNHNAFIPRWFISDFSNFFPSRWSFLYDITPLKQTLKKHINFSALRKKLPGQKVFSRLIISATDIQKGLPVVFDNERMDIDEAKIVSCAGYPFYGINWAHSDGRYLWDGALLSNTPMLQVIHASPNFDKKYYIVDVFPRQQEQLPRNMMEVWHRARDIIFMDKTDRNIEILKEMEKYILVLKKLDDIIGSEEKGITGAARRKLKEVRSDYQQLIHRRGAVIRELIRIGRRERMHYLLEDADFSRYRVTKLIKEGETDALRTLEKLQNNGLRQELKRI